MEAKDIIIKLIDNHQITGEEAFILIEALPSKKIEDIPTTYPNTTPPWNYPIVTYYGVNI